MIPGSPLWEDGDQYEELRGVELVGRAEIVEAWDDVLDVARSVLRRYHDLAPEDVDAAAELMANKRVGVRLVPERTVSWDHRKLAGGY